MARSDTHPTLDKVRLPPVAPDHLPRPRLVQRLTGTGCTPVTLVCAPSGFGKSSLVAHWARESEEPVAWLNLDAGDGDVGTFTGHLAAALHTIAPGAGEQTKGLLRKRSSVATREYGRALLADLGGIEVPLVLVLDDYSSLPPGEVHDLVDQILPRLPASMRLVLIARHDPSLAFQELLVAGRACEIRQRALAFTTEETAAYLEQQTGWAPDSEQLERLADRLGGWPTGLRLLAQRLADPDARDRVLERLPDGVLQARRYLFSELFDRVAPAHQDHLLRCSLFDAFTSGLCAAVAGPQGDGGAEAALPTSESTFVTVVEGRPSWFRIRPLFRELLEERCQVRFNTDVVRALRDRAARWFSEHGHLVEALDQALRGHAPSSAAGILADHRVRLINEGRFPELLHAMQSLPDEVIDAHLDTRLLRVWVTPTELFEEAIARVEAMLAREEPQLERSDAVRGELRLIQAGRFFSQALEGPSRLRQPIECAKEALELLPTAFPGARAMAYHLLAQCLQFSGKLGEADALLDRGLAEFALRRGHPWDLILYTRSLVHFVEADLVVARDAALQALADVPPEGSPSRWIHHPVRDLLGGVYHQWNELDRAEEVLDQARASTDIHSAQTLVRVLQAQGKASEASALQKDILEKSAQLTGGVNLLRAHAGEAALALNQGRPAPALRWAEGARTEDVRPIYSAIGITLIRARILIAAGGGRHRQMAEELLETVERAAALLHQEDRRLQILALRSLLRSAEGDDEAALTALGESVKLASRGRYVRLYLDLGADMRSLLARLPVPSGYEEYVAALREAFAKERLRSSARVKQDLPDPLSDRELEVLGRMAERLSNKEIASRLYVSVPTVKSHALKIYQKLHVRDRRAAVEKAVALGILPEP